MKKLLQTGQILLFAFFIISLLSTLLEISGIKTPLLRLNYAESVYNNNEAYNPALKRLDNISRLQNYCDSLFEEQKKKDSTFSFESGYPQLTSRVVMEKFFHGYSNYGFNNNYMALVLEPLTGREISAIVIPDDIMKYPYAACSQQSLVFMDLLKRKKYSTRKVTFTGKKSAHFCFEVYYNGNWHFFDANLEPDSRLLDSLNRPSIAELAVNDTILLAAYSHLPKETVLDLFKNYSYGTPDKFSAPNALVYQKTTKFLSYTAWIFFLVAFIWVRRKYLRLRLQTNVRNKRVYIPQSAKEDASASQPGLTTQGT